MGQRQRQRGNKERVEWPEPEDASNQLLLLRATLRLLKRRAGGSDAENRYYEQKERKMRDAKGV